MRVRFDGWIAGIGTGSGTRLVLGHWPRSPFGPVSDVMVEHPGGHRVLLAQTPQLAAFVAATYVFDEVRVVDVGVAVGESAGRGWRVEAGPLRLEFAVGRRGALGWLLRAVPSGLARHPGWVRLVDLPARLALRGVRTHGSAGNGRREWYGVRDLHPVAAATATWDGRDLGPLTGVEPPVRFGFASTPRHPSLARITTTVEVPDTRAP
ncbi:hypothetical protein ACQP2P_18180 [Dactylosporangium sp. CA-139114]|uniref:hypothetical protein n=1 Tax=Dactylosporangium sp. CA-139114 TaxID=3239931 RepID=UPI003D98757A